MPKKREYSLDNAIEDASGAIEKLREVLALTGPCTSEQAGQVRKVANLAIEIANIADNSVGS